MTGARRWARPTAVALVLLAAAGCASVPAESPVEILRELSPSAAPTPGLVSIDDEFDLVRGFVRASASSVDGHGQARRFLAPDAVPWADSASVTVLDPGFGTLPVPVSEGTTPGAEIVRIRGTARGRLTSIGAFEPGPGLLERDVRVRQDPERDGPWRIVEAPAGVVVPLPEFTAAYRDVRAWFVDPSSGRVVPERRYVPDDPASAQPGRVIELLLAGPSAAVDGAVISALVPQVQLRSNVVPGQNGAMVVDLTRVGDLDDQARRRLAAQVVLSLAEVGVSRVALLVDGEPLLAGLPELTGKDVGELVGDRAIGPDVPGLVVSGGLLRELLPAPVEPGTPVAGQAGNGAFDVASAALTLDGTRLAVAGRQAGRQALLVGAPGGGPLAELSATGLVGDDLTRPTWTPDADEVWTVIGGSRVARVVLDEGPPRTVEVNADELSDRGPITSLRLSRDGIRAAVVAGEVLYVAAVVRSGEEVALRNVVALTPPEFAPVAAADWRGVDRLTLVGGGPEPMVATVSVDGLTLEQEPVANLTAPLTAVAAAPNRALVVADATGLWSYGGGDQSAWRPLFAPGAGAVPLLPG